MPNLRKFTTEDTEKHGVSLCIPLSLRFLIDLQEIRN
jgi:hypothetical protein